MQRKVLNLVLTQCNYIFLETTALFFLKAGFRLVKPTTASGLLIDLLVLSLEIWCHSFGNVSLQCYLFLCHVLPSLDDFHCDD